MKNPRSIPELLAQLRQRQVPLEEYDWYVQWYLDDKARRQGIPLSGKFELTPLCNLDCKMCYVHLNREQMGAAQLMRPESWKEIMTQAAQMGMLEAILTGGECLTYPHFEELYLHLHSLGVRVSIYTNGLLLDEKRIAFLAAHPPKSMQISLYGSCEAGYEAVTGHRQFHRVLHNIQAAKAAGLPFHLAITPSIYMEQDVDATVRLAHSLGTPFLINWSLFDPRENTGRNGRTMDLPIEDYIRIYQLQRELEGKKPVPVDPAELPDFGGPDRSIGQGLRCGGGRSSFSVGYDGKMYICGMLRDTVAYPLETGFREAWRIINHAAEHYPVPRLCEGCEYRGKCPTCVVHHRMGAACGEVNPAICARTMRMAAEGLL